MKKQLRRQNAQWHNSILVPHALIHNSLMSIEKCIFHALEVLANLTQSLLETVPLLLYGKNEEEQEILVHVGFCI